MTESHDHSGPQRQRELVDRIKTAILEGGDFDSPLAEIIETEGAKAIMPLLLMMDFNEDQTHEMYAITHAVESFPDELYVKELIQSVEDTSRASPNFLRFLLARIMNSQDCSKSFEQTAQTASDETKRVLLDILGKVRTQYLGKSEICKNCDHALSLLSKKQK